MMAHPGKKLLFMGGEIAQFIEWDYKKELDWTLLDFDMHRKFHLFVKELNHFYQKSAELWEQDDGWDGFQWINPDDSDKNILTFRRIDKKGRSLIAACNFSPVERKSYRIGVPKEGIYKTVFHSGLKKYGGSCEEDSKKTKADSNPHSGYEYSLKVDLPGLSTIFWR
jgi:1,4-alpha-glucan branching enzyme